MSATFQAVPIFRIFDVEKARAFYVGFLGFEVACPGSTGLVQAGLEAYRREITAKGYRFMRRVIEMASWNAPAPR
jgi:hypothetical protein